MNVACEGCQHRFFSQGSGTEAVACPDCGGRLSPERDQPGGVNSDFQDLGHGNPLQEGMLGGWQNRMKRDESFASVKVAEWHLADAPQHTFQVELGRNQPEGMIHNGNQAFLSLFDPVIDGKLPIDREDHSKLMNQHALARSKDPYLINVSVHHPDHEPAVRELIEKGARQSPDPGLMSQRAPVTFETLKAIRDGLIPPPPVGPHVNLSGPGPHAIQPEALQNSLRNASVKMAEWGGGFSLDFGDNAPVATHKFIVDSNGQVYSKPEPTHHEDIANEHGLVGPNFPRGLSLGLLKSDGSTDWYSHENGLHAGTLAQTLEGHFKQPITIDPNLKPTTSEERFQTPEEGQYNDFEKIDPGFRDRVKQEQELVQQRGRPFPHYENPFFNRGGSLDQTIHIPWEIEKTAGIFGDIGDAASDAAGAVGDAASGVGNAVGDAAGAVGDAGAWAGNEIAQHPVDAALTAAMFVPGIGTAVGMGGKLVEGALTGARALRGAEDVAKGEQVAGDVVKGEQAAGDVVKGTQDATDAANSGGAISKMKDMIKGGLSPKALGQKMITNGVVNTLTGGGSQAPSDPTGGAGMLGQTPTLQQVSHVVLADTDTPTSLKDIPGADSGDPEDADTGEFNDGSDTTNPENAERDEAGGADTPADKQDNDTPGIALLKHLWPYALAYYASDESGADDPLIKALDEALEKDHPGYKEKGKDFNLDGLIEHFVGGHLKSQKHAALPPAPGMPNAALPPVAPPAVGPNPSLHACPVCGALLDASGVCHQCGFGGPNQPQAQQINRAVTPGTTAKTADTQGPVTPEQQKLVAQFLIEHGRSNEIPTMLDPNTSWQYADILQQIQRRVQTPAPPVAVPSQPPPPPGAMPGMDPSAGAPPPDPNQQVAAAVARFAADNIAPKCPKCGSHTTGIVGEDAARCHACGNQFSISVKKMADKFDHQDLHATPIDDVDNDNHAEADQDDVTYNWETTDGTRLEPGKEYEMHSENYSVPDIVKIVAVKPDELVYRIEGEFADLEDEGTIDRQTAKLEGLTFVPVDNADVTPNSPSADKQPRVNTEPTPASAVPFTSSFDFSSEHVANQVQEDTNSALASTAQMPKVEPPAEAAWLVEGTNLAGSVPAPWETPLPDLTGGEIKPEASTGDADWLLDGVPASRIAGAKFSPQQQREFIDEDGEARNLDRLDLENTHYRTRETSVFVAGRGAHRHAQPEMVREDDFALGL